MPLAFYANYQDKYDPDRRPGHQQGEAGSILAPEHVEGQGDKLGQQQRPVWLHPSLAVKETNSRPVAAAGASLAAASAVSWQAQGAFATLGVVWGWALVPLHVATATAVCC